MQSEKRKLYMQQYKKEHREQQAIYFKRWYEKNGRKRVDNYYKDIILVYRKKYPERYVARSRVYEAIKSGKLIKPSTCIICNKERYLNAHHLDYKQPLNIMWVCASCHKKIHLDKIVL